MIRTAEQEAIDREQEGSKMELVETSYAGKIFLEIRYQLSCHDMWWPLW